MEIAVPRDRNGTFEPQLIRKHQTRLTQFDDQILALYAKGMRTRDIVAAFQEMVGAEISATLVSKVTDAVLDRVIEWQNRPLEALYPLVYLDCIRVNIRQDKRVVNKAIYLALGIHLNGHKDLPGLWLAETEGAKFWLSVLTELQTRGLKDIFIAAVDGLTGFKVIYTTNAIESLNSVIRKAINNRKVFPTDPSATKVVYLAIEAASKKGNMPIHHWQAALNRFVIEFPGRMPEMFSHAGDVLTLGGYTELFTVSLFGHNIFVVLCRAATDLPGNDVLAPASARTTCCAAV